MGHGRVDVLCDMHEGRRKVKEEPLGLLPNAQEDNVLLRLACQRYLGRCACMADDIIATLNFHVLTCMGL